MKSQTKEFFDRVLLDQYIELQCVKDIFHGKEIPEILPEIEQIEISNEEYQKIQDMFKFDEAL